MAETLTHEHALEDRALGSDPESWVLGTFGDPAFDSALEVAIDLIDGGTLMQQELDWLKRDTTRRRPGG